MESLQIPTPVALLDLTQSINEQLHHNNKQLADAIATSSASATAIDTSKDVLISMTWFGSIKNWFRSWFKAYPSPHQPSPDIEQTHSSDDPWQNLIESAKHMGALIEFNNTNLDHLATMVECNNFQVHKTSTKYLSI